MIVPRYVPGDWVAVVSDGVVALLPGGTSERTVDRLWTSLREGAGLGAHLEVLVEGGLAALPPFALVSLADGAVHAVVRGAVRVLVDADDGEHELDGSTVTTWHEASITGARTVQVLAGAAQPRAGSALPVLSAVVRAAAVEVELVRRAAGHGVPPPAVPVEPPAQQPRVAEPEVRRVTEPPARVAEPEVRRVTEPQARLTEPHHEPVPPRSDPLLPPPAPRTSALPPVPVPALVPDAGSGSPSAADGDHDGLTVLSSDVAALRRQLPEWAGDAVPGPFTVPAPQAPPPAKIHLSSGLVISLNRPVLLGRAPQVSRVQNAQIPRLVTVASPNQDISRTHAEVRQDGEHVLVTDLRSTNGVLLLREGAGPQRLHPGEPTVVEPGVVVDLGEGVTFAVEHTG